MSNRHKIIYYKGAAIRKRDAIRIGRKIKSKHPDYKNAKTLNNKFSKLAQDRRNKGLLLAKKAITPYEKIRIQRKTANAMANLNLNLRDSKHILRIMNKKRKGR